MGGLFLDGATLDLSDDDLTSLVQHTGEGADAPWDAFTRATLEASCACFAQEVLTGPPQAPYNGRFLIGEHHESWDELVDKHDRICILAARDHGKTFFFDFAFPIWKAIKKPRGKGFIFSATQTQAERILNDIKAELESNPQLQWLVPTKKELWSSTTIKLSNGHVIYARGFGTKVRGAHPDWIVVDDGLNDETAYSEMVRQKQIDYFFTAITNMIVPGGQIVVIGTPYHVDDLYGELEKNTEYAFARFPAWIEKEARALWSDRYDKARLEARKREIGSIRFAREFLCVPVADDMSLFPSYLFRGDPTEQFTVKLGMPKEFWDALGVTAYMGVDFAMSSSVKADYTVVWTMGSDKAGNRWVMDIQREKGMAYQQQLSLIVNTAKRYDPALVFLEANQMQRIFGDELIRTTDIPIKKFTTGVAKNTLDKGVPSLRVLLENGKFRIPRGDTRSIEMTDIWINEMRNFTYANGKLQSVGGHDDLVMAAWICDQAIRQGGFNFSFDGDENDAKLTLDEMLAAENAPPPEEGSKESEYSKASGNLVGDEVAGSGLPLNPFFSDM